MTREDTIICLQGLLDNPLINKGSYLAQALEMAIQALSQEPISLNDINNAIGASFRNGVRSAKVEQEPCDDMVSREDRLIDLANAIESDDSGYWTNKRISSALRNISSVTHKSGKWIKDECGNVICSECKRFRRDCRYGHTNYCNHCGCRMFEPQESEDKE